MNPKAVVLLSGGLDSSTAPALAIADGYKVIALSFLYGQLCLERELLSAQTIALLQHNRATHPNSMATVASQFPHNFGLV